MGSDHCRRIRPGVIPWWASQPSQMGSDDNDSVEQVDSVETTEETGPTIGTTGEPQKLNTQLETTVDSGNESATTDEMDDEWDPICVESDEYVSEDSTTPTTTMTTQLPQDETDISDERVSARF